MFKEKLVSLHPVRSNRDSGSWDKKMQSNPEPLDLLVVSFMKTTRLVLAFMTLFATGMRAGTEEQQIVDTVSTVFAALSSEDTAKYDSVTSQDFYVFEGGARFNRDAIMGVIKAQHTAGRHFEWNVTDPDIHVDGNSGWITYTNKGSITDSSGTVKQNWLESAFLQRQADHWKVVFMHSTRVAMRPQESQGK